MDRRLICTIFVITMQAFVGDGSKLSAKFTRLSLDVQRELANKVRLQTNSTVYVFDDSRYFEDATNVTVAGVRALKKGEFYAVLSAAAQGTFPNSNTYIQFTSVLSDKIGVKISLPLPRVVDLARKF